MSPFLRLSVSMLLFLSACASHQAVMPTKAAVPSVRRLAVQPFEGTGGADITKDLVQALKAAGWTIVDKNQSADAVLSGTVHDYAASRKRMIFLGDTAILSGDKTVTVSNPVVSMNGSQALPQGPSPTMTSPQMVTVYAAVGLTARLAAASDRNILWGDDFSYESLELARARRVVVNDMVSSLNQVKAVAH